MRAIRVFLRSFKEAFKSVFRNFSLSIASVTCTTITLILVSIAILFSYNVNNVTKKLENELTIIVYLEKDATKEQADELESKIISIKNVEEVKFKSKDEWKFEMMNYSTTLNTTLSYLKENPLLDSFVVKVKNVRDLRKTSEKIQEYEIVRSAEYGEGMVEQLVSIFDIIEKVTIIIVIALVLVTAFLINNTIKLTIFSRRSEIEIMRLVGTSNYAIKLPFIFEGLFLGIIGSIIPIILTIYGYIIAYTRLDGHLFSNMLSLVKPFNFVLYVSLVLVAIGGIVGVLASYRAVRKYLKV
ncbi:MAG: permease-like cell division protein FtsX [Bacilli bacterium]|nr:permease-like cell division protein FtsX [Bacilli bacterium]